MRRPIVFGLVLSLTMFFSITTKAFAGDQRWLGLTADGRVMVDRLAADLYQAEIERSAAYAIEAETSRIYSRRAPVGQARFRAQRRDDWRRMSPRQRQALRNAKAPNWRNLTTAQKAPFRQHAMDILGAGAGSSPGEPQQQRRRGEI